MRKISYYIIVFILLWSPLQDTILSFIFRVYPTTQLKLLLVLKEILILFALFLLILRKLLSSRFPFTKIEVFSFIFLLISILHLIFIRPEGVPLITTFTTFRSVILPVIFVLVGKFLYCSEKEFIVLVRAVIFISVFSVIFGIIEMLIPVELFWNGKFFDLYGFLTKIKGLQEGYAGGFIHNVPGNFWGFVGLRRMAGFHASPLGISYYLITSIAILTAYLNRLSKKILFLFLIFGLLLTETRAAILATLFFLFLYFVDFKRLLINLKINKMFLSFFIFFLLLFFLLAMFNKRFQNFVIFTITGKEGRLLGHVNSFVRGLKHVHETILIGKGFGTAGSWTTLQGGQISYGGESAYVQIFIQTGILNFMIFLYWWYGIYSGLKNKLDRLLLNKKTEMVRLCKVFLFLQIAFFITGFMSEQIQAFTATHNFWILTGAMLGVRFSYS